MRGPPSADLDHPEGTPPCRPHPWGLLALLAFSLTAFSLSPLLALVPVYLHNQDYSHGLLVPVVALVLAWRVRGSFFSAPPGHAWGGGLLLCAGGLITVFGHWYAQALHPGYLGHVFLRGSGLLLAIWGGVWWLAGWRRTIILAPALGFLAFAIPLPESLILPVTSRLQELVSLGSAALLRSFGLEVFREGNILHLPSLTLGVGEACSGMRSLATFLATAFACAFLLQLTRLRTVLLLAAAPLSAVLANILRISLTAGLATTIGPAWLEGTRHELLGLATVLIGGAFILVAAMHLKGPPSHSPATGSVPLADLHTLLPASPRIPLLISSVLLGAAGLMLYTTLHYAHLPRPQAPAMAPSLNLSTFPRTLGPFQALRDASLLPVELEILRPTDHLVRQYADASGTPVELTVLYWAPHRTRPGAPWVPRAPHSPSDCMQACGWAQVPAFSETARQEWLAHMPLSIWLFEKPGQKRLVLYWNQSDPDDLRPFAPRNLMARLHLLAHSWNTLPEQVLPENYGVKIALDAGNNLDAAKKSGLSLAREAARVLPQFGIRPNPDLR